MQQSDYSEYTPSIQQNETPLVRRLYVALGIGVLVILTLLVTAGMVWFAHKYPLELAAVRDLFIIAFALETCLFGIILMILLVMVIRLVNMLEFEVKPILQQTNETVRMVRGTTSFVGENVVRPVATMSGYVAGVRRGVKVFFGNPRKNLHE